MSRRKRYTYFEYKLLVSPRKRARKLSYKATDQFLEAILKSASKLGLEVVGGCYPRRTAGRSEARQAKARKPTPKVFRTSPPSTGEAAERLSDLF